MFEFKKVSRFANENITMPQRKTAASAGYDMVAAEDVIIKPYNALMAELDGELYRRDEWKPYWELDEMAEITKTTKARPTLISTGMKAYMPKGWYLHLAMRSSSPLKYWLVMANGHGVIDADYADNPDNEGEIFLQVINFSPVPIRIKKGETICQGIFLQYGITDNDEADGTRTGGFGSTGV